MKVVQSTAVKKQIQRFKRFFEKTVIFNYSAKINGQFYYKVQYWRWGKKDAVGYLIMRPDGQLVPRQEAIPVMRLFTLRNIAAHRLVDNLARDKEKPVWMFEHKYEYLQALHSSYEKQMNESIRQDVQELMEVCLYITQSREKLRKIYDRGIARHHEIMERGYVIPGDEFFLFDCLYESDFIVYEGLRMQEIWETIDRLIDFFSHTKAELTTELKKKRTKLLGLLEDYNKKDLRAILETSITSFETSQTSKRVVFQSAEHFKEVYSKANEQAFLIEGVPLLRNT
ncbi:hypothetical protein NDK47_26875 [Brevibacillus ruminantium]|uniref:Uncharacterized protein n=1 Tax=Brevibacillus ruminantium TaxID=2950604 RepID=A0ABY4WFP6_9BACL|nr:hypothetical protein [Brevibacillus ruminantium]USG65679.1 hypothetical protein NDK47_26875 [Brevibacillus ruminantium]